MTMPKALWMSTYDLNKQAYRMAFFDGDGNVSEWLGHWDDVARTLSWTCEIAPGLKADAAWRFTDKDRYEYTLMVKDESGKVYADLSAKLKRKGAVAAIPDDPAGRKPAVEVEGLAPLDAFTGVWSTETTLKPAIWTKNASTAKGTTRFRWALGGRYQLEESAVDPGGLSAIVVRGYDEPRKSIRCRHFDASGGMTEMTGVWDAAAKTLREQGKIGDIDAIIQFQWADDKIVDWTATAKDNAGKLYLDASGKMRRQP